MFGRKSKKNKAGKTVRALRGVDYALKLMLTDQSCTAIILAAGSSTRMGDGKNKQFENVGGMPVLARSIAAFSQTSGVDDIILVARDEDILRCRRLVRTYAFDKVSKIVRGGETRRESVMAGFAAMEKDSGFVAVHDGARCLVTPRMIKAVLAEARRTGAASAGCPVKDTIKQVDLFGVIESTPDREKLWAAQTPQIFKTTLYRGAAVMADRDGVDATDDNFLVERLGGKVTMVDCGYTNIKITTPEDLTVAEALLRVRGEANRGGRV